MSADTPECTKLNHLIKNNNFRGNMPPNPRTMYCKTFNSLKKLYLHSEYENTGAREPKLP